MFKEMSQQTQDLIVESLNSVVTRLTCFNGEIAILMQDAAEPYQRINDSVTDKLENVAELFTEEGHVIDEVDAYAKMVVLKALNDRIKELETSMAHFIQFGEVLPVEDVVFAYESKIKALYGAQMEFLTAV